MNTDSKVNKDIIAQDFAKSVHGKMDKDKIDSAVQVLTSASSSYPATCTISSSIFYLQLQVAITGGTTDKETFTGQTGGMSTPGIGGFTGAVYTDNLEMLYRNTVSFQVTTTLVYLSILFFDGNGNLLGHFQSGGIGMVNGIGGGPGSWS